MISKLSITVDLWLPNCLDITLSPEVCLPSQKHKLGARMSWQLSWQWLRWQSFLAPETSVCIFNLLNSVCSVCPCSPSVRPFCFFVTALSNRTDEFEPAHDNSTIHLIQIIETMFIRVCLCGSALKTKEEKMRQ